MKKCEANSEEKKIMIKSGSSIMYLPLNKIICIETAPSDHKLIMQTMNRRIEFYSALKGFVKN
ncbi:hypothetical protein [Paramaledivibacter caminithermalis]|jgi:DNA-binding LytR/AlgR family response regulator|uniref:hypothetical protein n=1 Tax=Paramaledivibacter caminithermalis TaxID=191027 RepID=UPI0009332EBD|nr:hypothetical protein [Paramaledivibacter caminithermalis]